MLASMNKTMCHTYIVDGNIKLPHWKKNFDSLKLLSKPQQLYPWASIPEK